MTGKLIILEGPMRCDSFSHAGRENLGKTTTLIHIARDVSVAQGAGSVLCLQPKANVRDSGKMKGADGDWCGAIWLENPLDAAIAVEHADLRYLLIDEAHLWVHRENELKELILKAKSLGVECWLAGISIDHLGGFFAWWPLLEPIADTVHRLTAPCACGARAQRVFRHGLSQEIICVENPNRAKETEPGLYENCCDFCLMCCNHARIQRLAWRQRNEGTKRD